MNGGEVTFANARDLKDVTALKSSGGFAGEMISAGVANVGDINLGNKLNVVGSLANIAKFHSVVKTSSVTGFQSWSNDIYNREQILIMMKAIVVVLLERLLVEK